MRRIGLILCVCAALAGWSQNDSSSVEDILSKLSKLEKQKAANDTINSVKAITDESYATSLQPQKEEPKRISVGQVKEKKDSSISEEKSPMPIISFDKESMEIGNITQGDIVKRKFTFTNTGDKVLYVTQIEVGCGCTEPEWTQDAIQPGESGYIILTYDSKEDIGNIEKYATVVHNGNGYSYLELTGFVAAKL